MQLHAFAVGIPQREGVEPLTNRHVLWDVSYGFRARCLSSHAPASDCWSCSICCMYMLSIDSFVIRCMDRTSVGVNLMDMFIYAGVWCIIMILLCMCSQGVCSYLISAAEGFIWHAFTTNVEANATCLQHNECNTTRARKPLWSIPRWSKITYSCRSYEIYRSS